jgi:hypothetical protein
MQCFDFTKDRACLACQTYRCVTPYCCRSRQMAARCADVARADAQLRDLLLLSRESWRILKKKEDY